MALKVSCVWFMEFLEVCACVWDNFICFFAFQTWLIDRKGRRPLLVGGFVGAALGLLILTVALNLDNPVWLSLL